MSHASRIAEADAARDEARAAASPPDAAAQQRLEERQAFILADILSWTRVDMMPPHLRPALDRLASQGRVELKAPPQGPLFFRLVQDLRKEIAPGEIAS